jgi:hypothetical protein
MQLNKNPTNPMELKTLACVLLIYTSGKGTPKEIQ